MKIKKQKIYNYMIISGLSLVFGLLSYPFHKSEDFKVFKSLKNKKDFKVEDNNISRILFEVKESVSNKYNLNLQGSLIDFSQAEYFNENNYAVFIDARSQYEIDDEMVNNNTKTIPNAISLPVDYLDAIRDEGYFDGEADMEIIEIDYEEELKILKILDNLPRKKPYIVYCGSLDCDKSEYLANYMMEYFDFKNVSIYKGGWQDWKNNKNYD